MIKKALIIPDKPAPHLKYASIRLQINRSIKEDYEVYPIPVWAFTRKMASHMPLIIICGKLDEINPFSHGKLWGAMPTYPT